MKVLNFKGFMKKYKLKKDTMNKSQLQKISNYAIYPRDSKINSERRFNNIDNGSQGGTHWTSFIVKHNKSHYFDSFGGTPDKFLLNQLAKPIIYHKNTIQDINSKIFGSNCLYFFYLFDRLKNYDAILKLVFE